MMYEKIYAIINVRDLANFYSSKGYFYWQMYYYACKLLFGMVIHYLESLNYTVSRIKELKHDFQSPVKPSVPYNIFHLVCSPLFVDINRR